MIIGILVIILIIIVYAYYSRYSQQSRVENYRQCYTCDDDYRMLDGGVVVSNPYVWPFSGTSDVDKIYKLDEASRADFGFKNEPLIHDDTPDHVLLT